MKPWMLPAVMMLLSVGSAIVYASFGDWKRALYWAAASVITLSVTI